MVREDVAQSVDGAYQVGVRVGRADQVTADVVGEGGEPARGGARDRIAAQVVGVVGLLPERVGDGDGPAGAVEVVVDAAALEVALTDQPPGRVIGEGQTRAVGGRARGEDRERPLLEGVGPADLVGVREQVALVVIGERLDCAARSLAGGQVALGVPGCSG
nr:hypothetical protein [Streptomyces sp. TLI_235]